MPVLYHQREVCQRRTRFWPLVAIAARFNYNIGTRRCVGGLVMKFSNWLPPVVEARGRPLGVGEERADLMILVERRDSVASCSICAAFFMTTTV
jgi:hypothetical protein